MQTQIQNTVTVHIRNMCCQRCVDAVNDELFKLNVKVDFVKLGEATYRTNSSVTETEIRASLNKRGFEVIKSKEDIVVEEVRTAVFSLFAGPNEASRDKVPLSEYLSERARMPYRNISETFKKQKGISVEKYVILQRIEKVKDLIENSAMQFLEIAEATGYRSLQHLSTQFKNVTGMTMQQFKRSFTKERVFIDMI